MNNSSFQILRKYEHTRALINYEVSFKKHDIGSAKPLFDENIELFCAEDQTDCLAKESEEANELVGQFQSLALVELDNRAVTSVVDSDILRLRFSSILSDYLLRSRLINSFETDNNNKTMKFRKEASKSDDSSILHSLVPVAKQRNDDKSHGEFKKYWMKRYRLFSKFDEGIKLDQESWFSVTPEKIAKHIADRCKCDLMIDAFCGSGGNSIQFAFTCDRVFAIDIDPEKIMNAKHNARIYGVEDKIEFIVGDFFCVAERLLGDVVFLSPPWGGPSYSKAKSFDMADLVRPYGGKLLFETARRMSPNIAYFLPKNIDTRQLVSVAGPGSKVELEKNFLDKKLVAVTAYFGNLVNQS